MSGIAGWDAGRICKVAYGLFIGLLAAITLAALIDELFDCGWGLGWTVFFIGFIATAWGTVAYPVCCGCCGWDTQRH